MRILIAFLLAVAVAFADPCSSCGNDIPGDANFCPKCGAAKGATTKKVDEAVQAAEDKKREFIKSLEALKKAYEDAGMAQRASDIGEMIKGVSEVGLGPDAGGMTGGAEPSGAVAGGKSVKAANDLFEKAKLYMSTVNPARRGGNLGIAIDALREIIEKHPESDKVVDAWYNLGKCYQDGFVKRYEDSIKAYDKVKELDPNTSGDSRILAAQIVDKLGRYKEAYDRYEDVIRHDGSSRNVEWAKARKAKLAAVIK